MYTSPSNSSNGPDDLVVEIVETLEACGLEYDAYQLHEYVDVEALDKLIASPDGNVTVKFTVEGIRLSVSAEGVDILVEE
ncbi:HalOD1 output domain-containing protein [Halorubrum aquaticum]|uniref:HalOD1 output domain-containing protein n=1 Tax=Halorubrum aquaticum TaxID=387340 RepID=UPI00122C80E9